MKQIRLLPIVVFAASALLALKVAGIASGSGYTLSGLGVAQAQEEAVDEAEPDPQMAAADAAAEALFSSTPAAEEDSPSLETWEMDGSGQESLVEPGGPDTEQAILERLAERRAELDAFAQELETRLAVVQAAEVRIEERMAELSAIEAEINALVDQRETEEAEQFMAVVAMYENMRPGDAATIFNDLETGVLVRVGKEMNPRKLGPIMAKMLPVKAQQLTVLLAQNDPVEPAAPEVDQFADLPQIVGQ